VVGALPSVELVRFVNSGTEATMSAIRLARAATGRTHVVKFVGCYHGHVDGLLVAAGSGAATFGVPDSAGVPPSFAAETLVAPYNDLEALTRIMDEFGDGVAAILVEPIAGNTGFGPPADGFLQGIRDLCLRVPRAGSRHQPRPRCGAAWPRSRPGCRLRPGPRGRPRRRRGLGGVG